MFSCLDLVLVGCFAFEIVRLATVDCHPTEVLDCSFQFHNLGSSRDMTRLAVRQEQRRIFLLASYMH